jgi:pyrroloquinoline quinone (PQQ) biosynthesis protein C
VARLLETNYSIPRQATNFLRLHGSADQEHLEAAARAIEWYVEDRDHYADIDYATRMTYRNYAQLFTDVLELGDRWSR